MEMSILTSRQGEQKHQANHLSTVRFYPCHSYAKHDISCPFTAAADSVCSSAWQARARAFVSLLYWCPHMASCQSQKSFRIFIVYKVLCFLALRTVGLCCGLTTAITRCPCYLIHVPHSSLELFFLSRSECNCQNIQCKNP